MANPDTIDVPLAMELKAAGLSWRQIAEELSWRAGRKPPYRTESICSAVSRHKRQAVASPP